MLVTAGAAFVFQLNAVTFLISAAVIFSVNGDFRPSHSRREELAAGFTFLRKHHLLQPLTTAYGIAFVGIGVTIPAEVVLAADFGAGSLGYAGWVSLWGVGSLIGASLAKHFAVDPRRALLVAIAALMIAIGFLAVSVAPVFAIALIGMAIGGVGEGWWDVTQTTLMQRVTPDGIRARVFAGSQAVMQIGIAIGLLSSGLVTATLGASGAFGVAAARVDDCRPRLVLTKPPWGGRPPQQQSPEDASEDAARRPARSLQLSVFSRAFTDSMSTRARRVMAGEVDIAVADWSSAMSTSPALGRAFLGVEPADV